MQDITFVFMFANLAVVLTGCSFGARHRRLTSQEDYSRRTTFAVPYSEPDLHAHPEDRSQACSSDYTAALNHAATKDESALKRLFYISANSDWDAAGGELHTSAMRRMLLLWGDIDFARVLGRQPLIIRQKVLAFLTEHGRDPSVAHLFPHTYAAGGRS